jgi:hypothetical protein
MNILREVSELKNNCYELKRSVWNDIMEDWPFYSEAERAALRRRKPQNLTPPVSDTGSTSSGHSPSSTNPASPPQITNPLKRHGSGSFYDLPSSQHHHHHGGIGGGGSSSSNSSASEPNPKKKRVSHYKRPDSAAGGSSSSSHSGSWMRGSGSQHSPMFGGTGVSPAFGSGMLLSGSSPKTGGGGGGVGGDPSGGFVDESAPDWGQFYDHQEVPVATSSTLTGRRDGAPSPATAFNGSLPVLTTEVLGRSPVAGNVQRSSPAKATPQVSAGAGNAGWTSESDGEGGGMSVGGGSGGQLNMPLHFQNANKDFLT